MCSGQLRTACNVSYVLVGQVDFKLRVLLTRRCMPSPSFALLCSIVLNRHSVNTEASRV